MSVIDVVGRLVSMSTTLGAMPREGRRIVSRMSSRLMFSGSDPMRRYANAVRMPVRWSTAVERGVVHGTPASMQATCTGSRAEFTRARTAMSSGSTPPSCQDEMVFTARPASASAGASSTTTGPAPAKGPVTSGGCVRPPGRRMDLLVDAACVVREHVPGRIDDGGRAPVVDRQRVRGRSGEVAGEVDEELGRRPCVAVNDLIVVPDAEAVVRGGGQQTDEEQVGRVEILELVDEEVAARRLGCGTRLGIGQQDLEGPIDLLVEVDRTEVGQCGPVQRESLGDSGRVRHGLLDELRGGEPEPDGGKGLDVRRHSVRVGLTPYLDVALQEVPDSRLLEDPQPPGPAELVADPQPQAVQRTDVEGRRPVDVGAAEPQLARRFVVVGQCRHGARVDAAVTDEVAQALGEHAGLARTGRGNDTGRAGEMADGSQLVRSEIGDGPPPADRPEPSGFGIPAMHHSDPRGEPGRLWRAPVNEQRCAVGEQDVAFGQVDVADVVAFGEPGLRDPIVGEAAGRLTTVPPDGVATSGVVVVRPDQELQALAAELEGGHVLVDGAAAGLGLPKRGRVCAQFDDDGLSAGPVAVEFLHYRAEVGQGGILEKNARARRPCVRRLDARKDHHAAAQLDRWLKVIGHGNERVYPARSAERFRRGLRLPRQPSSVA